ncbi:MAG: efflux RND transporter periplasmic adaptor subunit [Rhodocyclales bacterium]|nr:efflux RND transporter periplasmic adaptor subunit [Rhodocyclales bacterium]
MNETAPTPPEAVLDTSHLRAELARLRRRRRIVLAAGLIALFLAAGLWFVGTRGGEPASVRYLTDATQRGDLSITVTATGNLSPTNQVEVGAEISGTIREVYVDFNDPVKVGQVLARLDTRKLEAQRVQAEANLALARAKIPQLKATLTEARAKLQRLQHAGTLSAGQAVAPQDLDTAQADVARAEAALRQAEAEIKAFEAQLTSILTDLDKSVIRSPIGGVVLKRSIDPGQTIAASLQTPVLFTLAEDLTQMELLADVDEADVGKVHEGQSVSFTVDAYPDQPFRGHVKLVRYGSELVNGVVTYKTEITVANPELKLRPGMTATAEILSQRLEGVLTIANAALRYRPPEPPKAAPSGGSGLGALFRPPVAAKRPPPPEKKTREEATIWVLGEDGMPAPVHVRLGPSDGRRTQILEVRSGKLEAGTPVITGVERPRP